MSTHTVENCIVATAMHGHLEEYDKFCVSVGFGIKFSSVVPLDGWSDIEMWGCPEVDRYSQTVIERADIQQIEIAMDTENNPPIPFMIALSDKYPHTKFGISYSCLGLGYCGYQEFLNGVVIRQIQELYNGGYPWTYRRYTLQEKFMWVDPEDLLVDPGEISG